MNETQINTLIQAVEDAIANLEWSTVNVSDPETHKGIAIQPLHKWGNQAFVLDFKASLKREFSKVIKDFT